METKYIVVSRQEIKHKIRLYDRLGTPTGEEKIEAFPAGTAFKKGASKEMAERYAKKLRSFHGYNVEVVEETGEHFVMYP